MKTLAAILLGCLTLAASAQPAIVTVSAEYSGSDPVGTRLAYHFKEGLRRSAAMRYVEDSESDLTVHILSMPARANSDHATAYTAAWAVGSTGIFWTHMIGICGSDNVLSCADRLLIKTDSVRAAAFKRRQ